MEKKGDTVIPADLKRLFVSVTYMSHWSCDIYVPPVTKGLMISAITFREKILLNPSKAKLNPICHLLALLGAHLILYVSRIRINCVVTTFPSAINDHSRSKNGRWTGEV